MNGCRLWSLSGGTYAKDLLCGGDEPRWLYRRSERRIRLDCSRRFGRKFDTQLIGRRTFEFAVQTRGETAFTAFTGVTSIVFSRTLKQQDHPYVTIVPELNADWVRDLKAQSGKDIWLFGGGSLFRSFFDSGLVDGIEVAVIPMLLGPGSRYFLLLLTTPPNCD